MTKEDEYVKNQLAGLVLDEAIITVFASIIGICVKIKEEILFYGIVVITAILIKWVVTYALIRTGDYNKREKGYYRKINNNQNKIKVWEANGGGLRKTLKDIIIPLLIDTGIVLIFIMWQYNNQFVTILMQHNADVKNVFSSNMVSIVLASYGVFFANLTIVGTYLKQKSFLFEVDQNYMVRWSIIGLFISVVVLASIGGVYLTKAELVPILGFILSVIWFLIIFISTFLLLCALVVIYSQIYEKKILRDLHKLFWNEGILMTPNKIWYKSNMLEGLCTLYSNVIKFSKKISKDKIQNIKFGSVYENNVINNQIARKKYGWLMVGIVFFDICLFMPLLYYIVNNTNVIIFGVFYWIQILIWNLYFILYIYDSSGRMLYLNYFQSKLWGYYFEKETDLIYIHRFEPSSRKYEKYINAIKNSVALFNLARNMKYEDLDDDKVEQYYIGYMIENIKNTLCDTWNDSKNYLTYAVIPIVVCGCLSDKKSIKADIQCLIDDMKLTNDEKEFVVNASLCILRDFCGNDKEYYKREAGYKDMLKVC